MDNKKKILIVCPCSIRGGSIGLIEEFLTQFDTLREDYCDLDLYDTNFYEIHKPENYKVNRYYGLKIGIVEKIIRMIPRFRAWYSMKRIVKRFKEIMNKEKYDLVISYQVPPYIDKLVTISHQHGAKIALFPWGSEVLRANKKLEEHLRTAYDDTDYVAGYEDSNLILKARNVYKVPGEKIKEQKIFFKGIKKMIEVDKSLNRSEMAHIVGIPESDYNIICGYSGCRPQRHIEIINAIVEIKDSLPINYQLVFPVTYVAEPGYIEELKNLCDNNNLKSVFLTQYLTDEQIAYLHLLTDLYINIQPSDAGNAFMIEALYCNNQIIVGKWLNYVQFEKYGVPYHTIETIDELPVRLKEIFLNNIERIKVPKELIEKYSAGKDFDKGAYWRNIIES